MSQRETESGSWCKREGLEKGRNKARSRGDLDLTSFMATGGGATLTLYLALQLVLTGKEVSSGPRLSWTCRILGLNAKSVRE